MRIVVDGVPAGPGRLADGAQRMARRARPRADGLHPLRAPRSRRHVRAPSSPSRVHPAAQVGVLFIEPLGPVHMCGHGTIAVATMLVETGRVAASGPETTVTLETPAGLVSCRVRHEDGRAADATFRNVPAFSVAPRRRGGRGRAWAACPSTSPTAGTSTPWCRRRRWACAWNPPRPRASSRWASGSGRASRRRCRWCIPRMPEARGLLYVQFYEPARRPDARLRNAVVVAPCGARPLPVRDGNERAPREPARARRASAWGSPSGTSPSSARSSWAAIAGAHGGGRRARYRSRDHRPRLADGARDAAARSAGSVSARAFSSSRAVPRILTLYSPKGVLRLTRSLCAGLVSPGKTAPFLEGRARWHSRVPLDEGMDAVLGSRYRRWLEVILPLYTLALLYVYFRPQSIPPFARGRQRAGHLAVGGVGRGGSDERRARAVRACRRVLPALLAGVPRRAWHGAGGQGRVGGSPRAALLQRVLHPALLAGRHRDPQPGGRRRGLRSHRRAPRTCSGARSSSRPRRPALRACRPPPQVDSPRPAVYP